MWILIVLFITSCIADIYKLHGKLDDGYAIDVDIGSPEQQLSLIVDTGSANLAVASCNNVNISRFYQLSGANCNTLKRHDSFKVSYTVGNWYGTIVKDVVRLTGGNIGSTRVNIALIYDSHSFFVNNSCWQGILGLGYSALAKPSNSVEPFFDTLGKTHIMKGNPNNTFSLQLCGSLDGITMLGQLSIAEVDRTQFTGKIFNVAVTSADYYQVIIVDMKVNNRSLDLECTEYNNPKSIVDSGTTNLALPSVVYDVTIRALKALLSQEAFASQLTDDFWYFGGQICSNFSLFEFFPVVTIDLMAENYYSAVGLNIPPNLYIRPVKMQPNCYKLGIEQSIRSSGGTILGAVVMEGFYIAFNRYKQPILQFGVSSCLHRNWSASISNYHTPALPPLDCHQQSNSQKANLPAYAVALLVIILILVVFTITYAVFRMVKTRRHRHHRLINNVDFQDLMHDTFDDPHI